MKTEAYENLTSFNSMKVRLKHYLPLSKVTERLMFQFHEGPIKTKRRTKLERNNNVSIP